MATTKTTRTAAEQKVLDQRYWLAQARAEQAKGQAYRLLGDLSKARRCAERMRAFLKRAK